MKINRGNIKIGFKTVMVSMMIGSQILIPKTVLALEDTAEKIDSVVLEDMEQEIVEESDSEEELTITKETIFTKYSQNMEFQKDKVIVKGKIQEQLLVHDILENIDVESLEKEYSFVTMGITGEDDSWLLEDDLVTSKCYLVLISDDFVAHYQIQILGDFNEDGLVDESDVQKGIDQVFEEVGEESKESIPPEMISYVDGVVRENSYEVEAPVEESLSNSLQILGSEESYLGDSITVSYGIQGLEENYFNTISGKIIYDHEFLGLDFISVIVDGKVIGKFQNDQFLYVFDPTYNGEKILIITFHSLKSGTTEISLQQLKVMMNGALLDLEDKVSFNLTIQEYGKGGDIGENLDSSNNSSSDGSPSTILKTTSINKNTSFTKNDSISNPMVVMVSNDNYIKNLEIMGYSISFDKDISSYSLDVLADVSSLQLNVVLNDENATYYVTGNYDFKSGLNEVVLTVYAEDGSSRDYVINVYKQDDVLENSKAKETTDQNDSSLKKGILLVILILLGIAIIGIIYRLLKEED